jgi:ATP-dependent Zn protease
VFFIGATNVPIGQLDPALIRPGRMGRHVWFRTPTKDDRKDIFNLYLSKVSHEPNLDTDRRRDELARITNGYSPAMIEQVCSMALTFSHSEGRERFGWQDIVESMTTVESGTAQRIEYIPEETRSVAIHEAGHAVAGHLYMKDTLSTRLSIRKRGGSLGHHHAIQTQERFTSFRSEEFAGLVWGLGALAAENVFYDENTGGVGGDIETVTLVAGLMVGFWAMGPHRVEFRRRFPSREVEEAKREEVMGRYEEIGARIMARAGSGVAAVLNDPDQRRAARQLLGQAYVLAHATVTLNRDKLEQIAEVLMERKEIHGDEVVDLLNEAKLEKPELDVLMEETWPRI